MNNDNEGARLTRLEENRERIAKHRKEIADTPPAPRQQPDFQKLAAQYLGPICCGRTEECQAGCNGGLTSFEQWTVGKKLAEHVQSLSSEIGATDPAKNPAILTGLPQLATKDDLSRHLGDNSQQVANYATPRTDAYEHNMGSITEPHYVVDADFSRTLERENANLRAENLRLKVACDQYSEDEMLRPIDDLRRQLDRMRVSTVQQELEMEGLREKLRAATSMPCAPSATEATSLPVEAGAIDNLWSPVRSIMAQGASIMQDYMAGNYDGYEAYCARLDAAARERADELEAHLNRLRMKQEQQ